MSFIERYIEPENPPVIIELSGQASTRRVWLNGEQIHPDRSQLVRNHSPDGFNWGYGGSGPAQLALAVCIEIYGEEKARKVYQDFKFKEISRIPMNTDFIVQLEMNY